jgi:hypothetical protein
VQGHTPTTLCTGEDEIPLISKLPDSPVPPDGIEEPGAPRKTHDFNVDTDLGLCYPYVLHPEVRSLEVELYFQPSGTLKLEQFQFNAAAHFHGVSHSQGVGARFPYVNSCLESGKAPISGFELVRINSSAQAHCVTCRCKLTQVPLGVSCILLTFSSQMLNALKTLNIAVFMPHPRRGRLRIAHKGVDREALSRILMQAKMDGGTLTALALVQSCGWWHIYSFQSFFDNLSSEDFIRSACRPRTV